MLAALVGAADGPASLERRDLAGRFVDANGDAHETSAWQRMTRHEARRTARTPNLLVRADLLASGAQATATSLQLEYLPGGEVCTGQVTAAQGRTSTGRVASRTGRPGQSTPSGAIPGRRR